MNYFTVYQYFRIYIYRANFETLYCFNPFRNTRTLKKKMDRTKLKAFADDKLNVTKMLIYVFDRLENIVGKGEMAGTSNFSFSHIVFPNASFPYPSEGVIVLEWVNFVYVLLIKIVAPLLF